jgi:uncharacterized protein with GYD domain
MQTFILMTKLSPDTAKLVKKRKKLGHAWIDQVHNKCPDVKFLGHYALLGPWDFMDIYEAPDQETAARVAMISLENGAFSAETWNAIPYQRFVELAEKI